MTFDRYKNFLLVALLAILWSVISVPASAVEIYSVVRKNCEKASGPIVYVQDDDVFVLTYAGKIARIPRDEISIISRYQVQHPPRVGGVTTDRGLGKIKTKSAPSGHLVFSLTET